MNRTHRREEQASAAINLVIPNIAEFNLRQPNLRLDPKTTQSFVRVGNSLADQCVLWTSRPRILVLPAGVDRLWFTDLHSALRLGSPSVISPATRTGLLILDLLADAAALVELRERLDGHDLVRLWCWGATPSVYPLRAALESWGAQVDLDVPADDDHWSSLYLESKMSCVDLAAYVEGFRVPPTIVAANWQELRGALRALTSGGQPAIVKSPHGVGGEGSAVVPATDAGLQEFWAAAQQEPFFHTFPLIVQEYVRRADDLGCPAVDLLIRPAGVEEMVSSVMTVDGHRFRTVNVGPGLLPATVERAVLDLGERVGSVALTLGFRGWLGIDFLVSGEGELFVTEINARRTGGMHAIGMLHLSGEQATTVTHSNDFLALPPGADWSYARISPVFHNVWDAGWRVYPTTVRNLTRPQPTLGVLSVGAKAEGAERMVEDLRLEIVQQTART